MEKFVPYEKRSKKEKRKLDAQARTTWGSVNPVTRKPQNSKAYNRSKARNWKRELHEPIPGYYCGQKCALPRAYFYSQENMGS